MNAIGELFGQTVLRRLGWVLLHFVWQGAIVAAVAAGGLHLLRRRSASARYLLACAALGLLACLPLLTAWLMPELMEEIPSAGAPVAAAAGAGLAARPVDLPPGLVLASPTAGKQPEPPLPALSWPQRASRALGPALPYVVGLWVIGVLALSMWRAIGFARVRQLRLSGTLPAGESLAGEFSDLARRLGLSRRVRLMRSSLARVPVVIGWLRPVVLLPASALTGLTAEQLRAVLVHELAHVRRHDYLVNLIQTVVETLLFYHPAVWWLSSRVRAERENCCDDVAAAACPSRCAYAEALVAMARLRPARVRLAVAADGGTLLSRVRRLLAPPAEREGRPGRWLAGLIAIATVVVLAVAIPLACGPVQKPHLPAASDEESSRTDQKATLRVLEIKFDPIAQGKNFVRIRVRNTTAAWQTFALHVFTKSPQFGSVAGMGWGRPFFGSLDGNETKWLRFPFKIQGPIRDDTRVTLGFYNPDSPETYDPEKHFQQKKYTALQLKRKAPVEETRPAPRQESIQIRQGFLKIQSLLRESKYREVWKRFTKSYQQLEHMRFESFQRAMKDVALFWWDKREFLELDPSSVARRDGVFVLTAVREGESWTIDFVEEEGLWKIDWVMGYTPALELWRNWEERLLPTMQKRSTDHFDIYYFKDSSAGRDILAIAKKREEAFQQICAFLGRQSDVRIRLVLFEDKKTKHRTTGHQGMGWATGATMVEVYGPEGHVDPYHETTHVLTRDMGRPPAAFSEGIAVYVVDRFKQRPKSGGKMSVYEQAGRLRKQGKWIALDELLTYTEIGSKRTRPSISYVEAGAFVKFLIDRYGKDKFFQTYGKLEGSSDSRVQQRNRRRLEAIYGQSLKQLRDQWVGSLEAAAGSAAGKPEDLKIARSLLARLDVPPGPAKPALPAAPAQIDARRTAEAFVSALGAGRDAEAIKLAAPGSAVARQIEAFRKALGRRPGLRVLSVHANDTVALARAAWTSRRRVPGSDRLILLIRLSKRPRRWMVGGIEQESLVGARAEVDVFLNKHPDAVALYATPAVREMAIYSVPKLLELLRERGSGRTKAEAAKWLAELIRAHVGKPAEWRANGGKLSQVTVADQARGVLLVSTTEANQASVRALLESVEKHGRKQILAEVWSLKLAVADEPQIRAWLAGQTGRKLPAGRESAFVVPDKTAAELARRIRDAKSGEALARPQLLLMHYATGRFFVGQNIPLKLAPSGDAGARKVIIDAEVGTSIEVHARIAADGKHIGISSEAEVTELAGANIQDRAYLKSDRPVPEKYTLVLRLPTRRYRLLGFREKLSGDGGRRRIEADKEAPAAERVDRRSGVERDFDRKLVDPAARPHSYVYILLKPTVVQPHVK